MIDNSQNYTVGLVNVTNTLSSVINDEFNRELPEQVNVVMSYAPLEKVSYQDLLLFLDFLPRAVDKLIKNKIDIIVVPSMTGSCIKGYEIVNMLEQYSGVPVIVPSLEMVNYLKKLKIDKIAIVSAFGVELCLLERIFFKKHGIEVLNVVNILDNCENKREVIDKIDSQLILEKVKESKFEDVDAVIFDSPTYRLRPIINEIKSYIKKPILSVNQVLIYSTLKKLNLSTDKVPINEYFI